MAVRKVSGVDLAETCGASLLRESRVDLADSPPPAAPASPSPRGVSLGLPGVPRPGVLILGLFNPRPKTAPRFPEIRVGSEVKGLPVLGLA